MNILSKSLLAASCVFLTTQVAAARDFTIAGWGGNYQDAQREAYFKPFMDGKGMKFVEATYLGGLAEVKTMADTKNITWDLVIVEGSDLQVGCDEGLFEAINWDELGGKDKLNPNAVQPCGAGNVVIGNGFAFNSTTFSQAPSGWADFFNPEKFPGKRGMKNSPKFNLEYALLADGVAPDKVYEVLKTPEGVDRAFAQLNKIKPLLQFWEAGAQPVEWLSAGNVAMSTAYNGRIITAAKEGKPLQFVWKNHIYSIDAWAIPTGSPYKKEALEFLKFANTAEPQAKFSTLMPYGPTNLDVVKLLPPETVANLPAGKNIEDALFYSDAFWIDNGDALTERWNNWATQ